MSQYSKWRKKSGVVFLDDDYNSMGPVNENLEAWMDKNDISGSAGGTYSTPIGETAPPPDDSAPPPNTNTDAGTLETNITNAELGGDGMANEGQYDWETNLADDVNYNYNQDPYSNMDVGNTELQTDQDLEALYNSINSGGDVGTTNLSEGEGGDWTWSASGGTGAGGDSGGVKNDLTAESPKPADTWGDWFQKNGKFFATVGQAILSYLSQKEAAGALNKEDAYLKELANQNKQLFDRGSFLREYTTSSLEDIVSGRKDLSTLPAYQSMRKPLEQQYALAKMGAEGNIRGEGALGRALTNIESSRASDIGSIPGRLYNDAFTQSMALSNPAMASGLLANSANIRQPAYQTSVNMYTQSNQQLNQAGQNLGSEIYNRWLLGEGG